MRWIRILLCIIIGLGCTVSLTAVSITIGSGTISTYLPMNRTSVYSCYESIISQTELAYAGNIRRISFEKASGSDVNPIQNVTMYLKHTTSTELATGVYSTTGYTQVYAGNFTNDVTSGWVSVLLSTPFSYNNVDNLQILIVKGMQTALNTTVAPKFTYTSTTPLYRSRFATSNTAQPTNLTRSYTRCNIRLEMTFPVFSVYPTDVDFGVQNTGTAISPVTIMVTNTGEEPLQITSAQLSGDDVFSLTDANTYPIVVNPGAEFTYEVEFHPVATGTFTSELLITDNLSRTLHAIPVIGSATRVSWSEAVSNPFAWDTADPVVELISPSTSAIWFSYTDKLVEYSAIEPNLTASSVNLQFSLNSGASWMDLLHQAPCTGTYLWQIPLVTNSVNTSLKLDVSDSFGNVSEVLRSFQINQYTDLTTPENLSLIIQGQNAVLTWEPTTTNVLGDPITPDYYLVFCNAHAVDDPAQYYFLDYTPGLTYTHHGVARFSPRMLYHIVAYKDYSRAGTFSLATIRNGNKRSITYPELLEMLSGGEK